MARERDAEGARGLIADHLSQLGEGHALADQNILRDRDAPLEEVLHRRHPHRSCEALREHRSRHPRDTPELGDGPSMRDIRVHPPKRASEVRIGEAREQALFSGGRFCGANA